MVLALTLLVVGGISLVNALTSEPTPPGPQPSATTAAGTRSTPTARQQPTRAHALEIEVIGSRPINVVVREPGTEGTILQNGPLNPGEIRTYDDAPLNVVVNDSSAVRVRIYGKVEDDPDGGRGEWVVPEK